LKQSKVNVRVNGVGLNSMSVSSFISFDKKFWVCSSWLPSVSGHIPSVFQCCRIYWTMQIAWTWAESMVLVVRYPLHEVSMVFYLLCSLSSFITRTDI